MGRKKGSRNKTPRWGHPSVIGEVIPSSRSTQQLLSLTEIGFHQWVQSLPPQTRFETALGVTPKTELLQLCWGEYKPASVLSNTIIQLLSVTGHAQSSPYTSYLTPIETGAILNDNSRGYMHLDGLTPHRYGRKHGGHSHPLATGICVAAMTWTEHYTTCIFRLHPGHKNLTAYWYDPLHGCVDDMSTPITQLAEAITNLAQRADPAWCNVTPAITLHPMEAPRQLDEGHPWSCGGHCILTTLAAVMCSTPSCPGVTLHHTQSHATAVLRAQLEHELTGQWPQWITALLEAIKVAAPLPPIEQPCPSPPPVPSPTSPQPREESSPPGTVPLSEVTSYLQDWSDSRFATWARSLPPHTSVQTAGGHISRELLVRSGWGTYKEATEIDAFLEAMLPQAIRNLPSPPGCSYLTCQEAAWLAHKYYLAQGHVTTLVQYTHHHQGLPPPTAARLCTFPVVTDNHYTTVVIRAGTVYWYDSLRGPLPASVVSYVQNTVDGINHCFGTSIQPPRKAQIVKMLPPKQRDGPNGAWSCGGHALLTLVTTIVQSTRGGLTPLPALVHTQATVNQTLRALLAFTITGRLIGWVQDLITCLSRQRTVNLDPLLAVAEHTAAGGEPNPSLCRPTLPGTPACPPGTPPGLPPGSPPLEEHPPHQADNENRNPPSSSAPIPRPQPNVAETTPPCPCNSRETWSAQAGADLAPGKASKPHLGHEGAQLPDKPLGRKDAGLSRRLRSARLREARRRAKQRYLGVKSITCYITGLRPQSRGVYRNGQCPPARQRRMQMSNIHLAFDRARRHPANAPDTSEDQRTVAVHMTPIEHPPGPQAVNAPQRGQSPPQPTGDGKNPQASQPPRGWRDIPLRLCTLNVAKAGPRSPSMSDLHEIIAELHPDVLFLTETPCKGHCQTVTSLLRNRNYYMSFHPPDPPQTNEHLLPEEARRPLNQAATGGGSLTAIHRDSPLAAWATKLRITDPQVRRFISGIRVEPPHNPPLLMMSVYFPQQCDRQLYNSCCDYLTGVCDSHPHSNIIVGGDFQTGWNDTTKAAAALRNTPLRHIAPTDHPTFSPATSPNIRSTLDHIVFRPLPNFLPAERYTLRLTESAFADHHALLGEFETTGILLPTDPDSTPQYPQKQLRGQGLALPLPPDKVQGWQDAVSLRHDAALITMEEEAQALLLEAQTASSTAPARTISRVEALAAGVTEALHQAYTAALGHFPNSTPSRPPHPKSGQSYWPRALRTTINTLRNRAKKWRGWMNSIPSTTLEDSQIHHRVATLYEVPEPTRYLPETTVPSLVPTIDMKDMSLAEARQGFIATQSAVKKALRLRNREKRNQWGEYLMRLWRHKPRKAIATILTSARIAAGNDNAPPAPLHRVKDPSTGVVVNTPPQVLQAVQKFEAEKLAASPVVDPQAPFPWESSQHPDPFVLSPAHPPEPMFGLAVSRARYNTCLRRLARGKATGPDEVPAEILQQMPTQFHDALFRLFQLLAETGFTPREWVRSHTVLLCKKGDPTDLDNYRPITLASTIYKLWTGFITTIATRYVEERQIIHQDQEGFRPGHSCSRAVAHLLMLLENSRHQGTDVILGYLDFKGAYPSVDHTQLTRTLQAIGLPEDFVNLIDNLYEGASTAFLTPGGMTDDIMVERGTLQGDPLSPLLFDLMIEPLVRWLDQGDRGCRCTLEGQHASLSSKWFADDVTVVAPGVAHLKAQLRKIEAYGEWSGIKCNVAKCRLTAYMHCLQGPQVRHSKEALMGLLADVTIDRQRVPVIGQEEPLPGTYLGTSLVASLSTKPHLSWLEATITPPCEAVVRAPLSAAVRTQMLAYVSKAKLAHTHVMLSLSNDAITRLDSKLAGYVKRIHSLPPSMATAAVHTPTNELGLGFHSVWEDYGSAATQVWLLLNDSGSVGESARFSLRCAESRFSRWPVSLALSRCPFLLGRAAAVLQLLQVVPGGAGPLWQGNQLASSIEAHCQPQLDEMGCQLGDHPYPPTDRMLIKISPLWDAGVLEWPRVLKALPGDALGVLMWSELAAELPLDDRAEPCKPALEYLQDLLSTGSLLEFRSQRCMRTKRSLLPNEYTVHPRWLDMLPGPSDLIRPRRGRDQTHRPGGHAPITDFAGTDLQCAPCTAPHSVRQGNRAPDVRVASTFRKGRPRTRRAGRVQARRLAASRAIRCLWPKVASVSDSRQLPPQEPGSVPAHGANQDGPLVEYRTEWAPLLCPPHAVAELLDNGFTLRSISPEGSEPNLTAFTTSLTEGGGPACHMCGLTHGPLVLCGACLAWAHKDCASLCAMTAGLHDRGGDAGAWRCPGCPKRKLPATSMCRTEWNPRWLTADTITCLDHGTHSLELYNEEAAMHYRLKRARPPQPPMSSPPLERPNACRANPPPHCPAVSSLTDIQAVEVNPYLDIYPTGSFTANTVPLSHPTDGGRVSIHGPSGRAVTPYCLSLQRYLWLRAQHGRHAPPSADFHQDVARLLHRYHPRSRASGPQGSDLNAPLHNSLQLPLTQAIASSLGSTSELYSCPLTCSMLDGMAYCSPFLEDERFGAVYNALQYRWTGSCLANPEPSAEGSRLAVEHAIRSSVSTNAPFLCLLTLQVRDDAPWSSAGLLAHPHVRRLLRVQPGKFRFVPSSGRREDTAVAPSTLTAVKQAVDLLIVANQAGMRTYVDTGSLEHTLAPAVRSACAYTDLHVEMFPPEDLGAEGPAPALPPPPASHLPPLPALAGLPATGGTRQFGPLWPEEPNLPALDVTLGPLQEEKPLVVIELCAGIATGLEALLRAGHYVSSYSWADINPDAHRATYHRLHRLMERFPLQLPRSAIAGWDSRIPFNCNCITPESLLPSFVDGIDIVIAGPPCQPYSTAGKNKGLGDPRSGALLNVARLITHLHATQPNGVRYIIENVPGTEKHPQVAAMLGQPIQVDAPPCGSGARRKTLFWQNLAPNDQLQKAFEALPPPSHTVSGMLREAGLTEWRAQPQTLGYNCFPGDPYNRAGAPQVAIPKMVCYPGSHAFRFKRIRGRFLPGPGMLYKGADLVEPDADVAEALMGFQPGDTAAEGLLPSQRRHLLGQCIDINLFAWLLRTASPRVAPGPPRSIGDPARHLVPGPDARLALLMDAQTRSKLPTTPTPLDCIPPATSLPPLPSLALGTPQTAPALQPPVPCRQLASDPVDWLFTDGSRCDSSSALGAAVVHQKSGTIVRLACTGREECNTVFRAELVGIHEALASFRHHPSVRILCDCSSAIAAVDAALRRPHERGYHHHRTLLHAISQELLARDGSGLSTVIRKVRAHVGIEGNELADWHAKFAAKNPQGTPELQVRPHTLGATPLRPQFWLFYSPEKDPPPVVAEGRPEGPGGAPQSQKRQGAADGTGMPTPKRPAPGMGGGTTTTDARPSASQNKRGWAQALGPECSPGVAHSLEGALDPHCPEGGGSPTLYAFTAPQRQIRSLARPHVNKHTERTSLYRRLIVQALQKGDDIKGTAAGLTALRAAGRHGDARRIFKFVWGQYYNGKIAKRYGHQPHDHCALCGLPDSCTHIGAGCPALSSHYMRRHQAAVQLIHMFIRKSAVGGAAMAGCPWTLVSCDGGAVPLADRDVALRQAAAEAASQSHWDGSAKGRRNVDPSLCIRDLVRPPQGQAALDESVSAPRFLPDWLLSNTDQQRLIQSGHGVAPDIVYAKGVPNLRDPPDSSYDPAQCVILLVEVGFCQDLRLQAKEHLKLCKYAPLLEALRLRWGRVLLVGIPMGIAGTASVSALSQLAEALCTLRPPPVQAGGGQPGPHRQPRVQTRPGRADGRDEVQVDMGALKAARRELKAATRHLRNLAQEHLLHIFKARTCSLAAGAEPSQAPATQPGPGGSRHK